MKSLLAKEIDTPLGTMLAMADNDSLLYLNFLDSNGQGQEAITYGENTLLRELSEELLRYFSGELSQFSIPIKIGGTPFQERVWYQLQQIPVGKTCSYAQLAHSVMNPKGYRAVARANGANPIAVIVPCHRVINASGALGGYSGGIHRKKWLIEHEQKMFR